MENTPNFNYIPDRFQIQEEKQESSIFYIWKSKQANTLLFVSIFWMSIASTLTVSFLGNEEMGLFRFFPLIHFSIGLVLVYYTVASFVNKTQIKVDSVFLEVSHSPMLWFNTPKIERKMIKNLAVERKEHKNKSGRITYSYDLQAIGLGEAIKLINFEEEYYAQLAQHHLAKFLKLDKQ